MTPKDISTYRKLSSLTKAKCETCPTIQNLEDTPYRCCDKIFCDAVKEGLPIGIRYSEPNEGGLPYMGKEGCVVPPHLRPGCTAFICPNHLLDKEFAKEYKFLCNRLGIPPMKDYLNAKT